MFVSCTSNLLEQMCGYRRYIMFLQMWILNLQDLPQSQTPETVPIYIVVQYFPHDNTICIHTYDEYMKLIDSGVCHKLWSILLWIVRAYLLTIKYQVVQFLPNISISAMDLAYMCVKPQMRLYVCQALPLPNTKCVCMCVTKCVYMCVTKCVYMCVTKCVC